MNKHSLHSFLAPIAIALFLGTFITDVAYWLTDEMMWERFSLWLLAAGVIMAALAAVFGLADLVRSRRVKSTRSAWLHGFGNILVLALAVLNTLVHTRDAYSAIVPWGVVLSGTVVVILLFTGRLGWIIADQERSEAA